MKIGALILTTGLGPVSGIASLMRNCGKVTAGQRLIAALFRSGITEIVVSLGKQRKKEDRQLAQDGVLFLHTHHDETPPLEAAVQAMPWLCGKYDRLVLVRADIPCFLPKSLVLLLESEAPISVPVYRGLNGCPVVLNPEAMEYLAQMQPDGTLEKALSECSLEKAFIPVSDPGIISREFESPAKQKLLEAQSLQLTRPVIGISFAREDTILNRRLSTLLHLVDTTHSVKLACEKMQISYSCAWAMLNRADDLLGYPLIHRVRGGHEGSGSLLTDKGRRWMEQYDRFSSALTLEAQTLWDEMFRDLTE